MRLLIDTDAFCKLAVAGLLEEAVGRFGGTLAESGRLAALPYMLRRGSLRRQYGAEACDRLIALAEAMPVAPKSQPKWVDELVHLSEVDPGEAQLLAVAADERIPVVSGDKRALSAIRGVGDLVEGLDGLVVVLEALLDRLCASLGVAEMRQRMARLREVDTMVRVCFSEDNEDPAGGLRSYWRDLQAEVAPLRLWMPATWSAE